MSKLLGPSTVSFAAVQFDRNEHKIKDRHFNSSLIDVKQKESADIEVVDIARKVFDFSDYDKTYPLTDFSNNLYIYPTMLEPMKGIKIKHCLLRVYVLTEPLDKQQIESLFSNGDLSIETLPIIKVCSCVVN